MWRPLAFTCALGGAVLWAAACSTPAPTAAAGRPGYVRLEVLLVDSAGRLLRHAPLALRLRGARDGGQVAAQLTVHTDSQGFYRETDVLVPVYPQIEVRLSAATTVGSVSQSVMRTDTTQLWLSDPPGDTLRVVLQLASPRSTP